MLSENPTEEEKVELANTLQMLQPNTSEVSEDKNLTEIVNIESKATENEETRAKNNESKFSSETTNDDISVSNEMKKTPDLDQKCSTLPRDDPSLRDDHAEIMSKANKLRTLSKVDN